MKHIYRIAQIALILCACSNSDKPPPIPGGPGSSVRPAPTPPDATPAAGVPDLTAIDRDIATAIRRRHEQIDGAVKKADERERQAEAEVERSKLGSPADRAKAVAAMKASWKNDHSPQANAIVDTEAAVEDKFQKDIDAAKTQPPEKQKDLLEQLVRQFPQNATDATTHAEHQAATDQLEKLIKTAAPLAIFAGCMALGGGPVCGLFAGILSKAFGGKELTHTDDIVGVINDVQHILSGDCDLSCLEEMALRTPLDDATVDEVASKLGKAVGKSDEMKAIADAVKKRSRVAKDVVACITDIHSTSSAGDIVKEMRLSNKCATAVGMFGNLDAKLAYCAQNRKPVLAAACMYACRQGASPSEQADCDRLQVTRE